MLTASREPESDFVRNKEMSVGEGMIAEAIVTRRTVSLNALTPSADFAKLADDGIVICVPLFTSDNQVLGVLTIERLPLSQIQPPGRQTGLHRRGMVRFGHRKCPYLQGYAG